MIDVSPSLALLLVVAVLVGAGVYLVLERSLTRVVIGAGLITHGINVLILVAGGRAGEPPLIGSSEPEDMSDPLPQAMILTAIVISLGITAFLLALAYRSWQLNGHDEVQDDLEDRRIARRAARDELDARSTDDSGSTLEEEAATTFDETDTGDDRRSSKSPPPPGHRSTRVGTRGVPHSATATEQVGHPDEDRRNRTADHDDEGGRS
ncbi:Na(+)/H(+) antiporter subunit C [Georgenia sp. Z1491]|uniref:Na(+)/H(+) antiporter subunit C n=1 Tax=Georgenia sp. Z1491 TaxID=3416707 RepID=UPI003CEADAD6